jgi:hypothetical protein
MGQRIRIIRIMKGPDAVPFLLDGGVIFLGSKYVTKFFHKHKFSVIAFLVGDDLA